MELDPEKRPDICLVLSYKTLKGVEFDEPTWNQIHFARCLKTAKALLAICGGLRQADACMVELSQGFEEKGLNWTLETIAKHASDWVQKKHGGANAKLSRKRFFDALAKSRSETKGQGSGELTSSREILGGLRNSQVPESGEVGTDRPRENRRNGGMLSSVDQSEIEGEFGF